MAAIGVALWGHVMQYAPNSPDYFNRDRFVLSNGHTCLFQYCFLHLTGYKDMTMEQLKSYHSKRHDALCPGHPEREHEGIEVTTGPLGQGISNAVGLAAASKHLGAKFNRPGFDIVSNHTWCMVGDACLQEGVALEAISLAGHWKLNNLTVIYDNNQITCDGSVTITNTEDVNAKMRACGWEVIDILEGSYDVNGIVEALLKSKSTPQPTFINVRTVIGLGSGKAGQASAHGAAFGSADVANMKKMYGFDPEQAFVVSDRVYDFFASKRKDGDQSVPAWASLVEDYSRQYPDLARSFKARLRGEIEEDWQSMIPTSFPSKPTATRAASGLVFNPIAEQCESFFVGTADLSPSVNMSWASKEAFQGPGQVNGSYSGRYVHYGIREHAMCAIANGVAAFQPNMIVPVTSSFFMFYLYAAPAVRMGALMQLQVIHAATHDSIGMGEDGPTHQPIELAALYRAMPNLLFIRPGDSEETAGAWKAAIKAKNTPTIISTSRHTLPQLAPLTSSAGVVRGAYVLTECLTAQVTIIGVGAELNIAVAAAKSLTESGVKTRIISFPSQRLFEQQDIEYRRSVLRRQSSRPTIVVEAYAAMGWERYANAAFSMSTARFGQSLPGPVAYEYFGFTANMIAAKIREYLDRWATEPETRDEFTEFTQEAETARLASF